MKGELVLIKINRYIPLFVLIAGLFIFVYFNIPLKFEEFKTSQISTDLNLINYSKEDQISLGSLKFKVLSKDIVDFSKIKNLNTSTSLEDKKLIAINIFLDSSNTTKNVEYTTPYLVDENNGRFYDVINDFDLERSLVDSGYNIFNKYTFNNKFKSSQTGTFLFLVDKYSENLSFSISEIRTKVFSIKSITRTIQIKLT